MYLYEYNVLSTEEKAEYLWQHGIHLTEGTENDSVFSLYSLGDFYVEVIYCKLKNEIETFRTFKKGDLLNPYLDLLPLW